MEWKIKTYQSVGPLSLGLKREELRNSFDETPEVKAMTESRLPMDVYQDKGLYLAFDQYDRCGAIELKKPAKAIFNAKDLLTIPYQTALDWLKETDETIEETEEQFVSWKHGILFYAPDKDKNPQTLADTITVFRKDFFYVKNGIPDPKTINSFHIHTAYVESIEVISKNFENVSAAVSSVFSNNKEAGFLIWNGTPVAFSYASDLPVLIEDWLEMIAVIQKEETGTVEVNLECISFSTIWKIKWNEKFIILQSEWKKVNGGYESALNLDEIQTLRVLKKDFLSEWKMLLKQCRQGLKTAKVAVNENTTNQLSQIENQLPAFGKFYQEKDKVITTSTDGRKKVDFSKLPILGQGILIVVVLTFIFIPVWLMSKDKDSVFWFWESMPQILLYLTPFLLIIVYVGIKIFKVWKTMK